jgi:hypothetical protein
MQSKHTSATTDEQQQDMNSGGKQHCKSQHVCVCFVFVYVLFVMCLFLCFVEICLTAQPLPTTPCAVSTVTTRMQKRGKNYAAAAALACSTDSPLGCLLLLRLRKRWKYRNPERLLELQPLSAAYYT